MIKIEETERPSQPEVYIAVGLNQYGILMVQTGTSRVDAALNLAKTEYTFKETTIFRAYATS